MSSITSAQSLMLKFVKQWLNLPHNLMPGAVFHPGVLDLPYLRYFQNFTKLSHILAIESSVDPMIVELCQSILTCVGQGVPNVVFNALSAAESSVVNVHPATKIGTHVAYHLTKHFWIWRCSQISSWWP